MLNSIHPAHSKALIANLLRRQALALTTLAMSTIILLATGCSSSSWTTAPQIDFEVAAPTDSSITAEVEKTSEAYHHFMIGELSFLAGDFDQAKEHYAEASKLTDQPAAELHSKLAELYMRSGELDKALPESKLAVESAVDEVDKSQRLLVHAGILEALEQYEEARQIYLDALKKDPKNTEARVLLSGVYLREGQHAQAIATLKTVLQSDPRNLLVLYNLGRIYEVTGEKTLALDYYHQAYQADVSNELVTRDILRIYLEQSDASKAEAFCREVLEQQPENLVARKVLSHLLIGKHELDEALEQFELLEDSTTEIGSDIRMKIALIQLERKNYPEATRNLLLVLAQEPSHAEARYYLASVFASDGKNQDALVELMKIEESQPYFAKAQSFAAFLYRQVGDQKSARKAIELAYAVNPEDDKVIAYYLHILREDRDFSEALDVVNAALQEKPGDQDFLFTKGVVLFDLQKIPESHAVMEDLLRANPNHANALNFVAYSYAEKGENLPKALELSQKALKLSPTDPYFLDTLGWIYYHMQDYKTAEQHLSNAVTRSNQDPVILEHYGDVLSKLGKQTEAIKVYRGLLAVIKKTNFKEDPKLAERVQSKLSKLE